MGLGETWGGGGYVGMKARVWVAFVIMVQHVGSLGSAEKGESRVFQQELEHRGLEGKSQYWKHPKP